MMTLREDRRLGGVPILRLCPEDEPEVELSEFALQSVAFVGVKKGKRFIPYGTGVFVSVRDTVYLVTCAHVLRDCGWPRLPVFVRVNRAGVGETIQVSGWIGHTDASVDAAAVEWPAMPSLPGIEMVEIPEDTMGTKENLKAQGFKAGVGDDVHIIGLFSRYSGASRNEPLCRRGSIAMIPDGGVTVNQHGATAEVNLVEVRSIGGMSGSPVFIHYRALQTLHLATVPETKPPETTTRFQHSFFLWGIMSSHWDIPLPHPARMSGKSSKTRAKEKNIATGISTVVPLEKVIELIDQPGFVRAADARQRRENAAFTPTLDSAKPHEDAPLTECGPEPSRLKLEGPIEDRIRDSFMAPPMKRASTKKAKRR